MVIPRLRFIGSGTGFSEQVNALAEAPSGDPELRGAEVAHFLETWFAEHTQKEYRRMVAETRDAYLPS